MNLFDLKTLNNICSYEKSEGVTDGRLLYEWLCINKDFILSKTDRFSIEDLWLSEYYWLLILIIETGLENDVGAQQQLHKLLENMENNTGEINWEQVELMEKQFNFNE